MRPVITAFQDSPDEGRGLARDMRVRWAFEEVGVAYDVWLLTFAQMGQAPHRAIQPFGQIPTYQEGGITLFESGAIVLHIAQSHTGLLPDEAAERADALSWLFAALNTIEPPIVEREQAGYLESDRPWHTERLPLLDSAIRRRLDDLARHLGDGPWLGAEFTAADLMMVTVLRRLEGTGLLRHYPTLADYIARGEARPAYRRAFRDQRAVFEARRG